MLAAPQVHSPSSATISAPFGSGFELGCAGELSELVDAWRLVYRSYQRKGLIGRNPFRIHTVRQACQSQSVTGVLKQHGRLAATISCYLDNGRLPLDAAYPAELAALRGEARLLAEVGLMAVDPQARLDRQRLIELMCVPLAFTIAYGLDAVVGVHPKHADFYLRIFGFRIAGPERSYAVVGHAPVQLLHMDIKRNLAMERPPLAFRMIERLGFGEDLLSSRFCPTLARLQQTVNPISGFLMREVMEHAHAHRAAI